ERKLPVYFHYPWSEDDTVEIDLPAGFSIENAVAPASISQAGVRSYSAKIGVTPGGRTLTFKRSFSFGRGDTILFPPEFYAQLKQFFDGVHERDNQKIALKQ